MTVFEKSVPKIRMVCEEERRRSAVCTAHPVLLGRLNQGGRNGRDMQHEWER
jgi:hypothetical protein